MNLFSGLKGEGLRASDQAKPPVQSGWCCKEGRAMMVQVCPNCEEWQANLLKAFYRDDQ